MARPTRRRRSAAFFSQTRAFFGLALHVAKTTLPRYGERQTPTTNRAEFFSAAKSACSCSSLAVKIQLAMWPS
eukprot:scaffold119141_cov63-Phaeocystis_antarctica.AAC.1